MSIQRPRALVPADYQLEGAETYKQRGVVDDYVQLHKAGMPFLHCLAAAEDYLEAKTHALLGIGSESSGKLYTILRERLGPQVGPMPVCAPRNNIVILVCDDIVDQE